MWTKISPKSINVALKFSEHNKTRSSQAATSENTRWPNLAITSNSPPYYEHHSFYRPEINFYNQNKEKHDHPIWFPSTNQIWTVKDEKLRHSKSMILFLMNRKRIVEQYAELGEEKWKWNMGFVSQYESIIYKHTENQILLLVAKYETLI